MFTDYPIHIEFSGDSTYPMAQTNCLTDYYSEGKELKEIVGIYSVEDREFHISRYEDGAFVLPSGECAAVYSLDEKSAKDKIILQIKHFYR